MRAVPPGRGPAAAQHRHQLRSPHDVTLAELTIESFFPADANTRQLLQRLAEAEPTGPRGEQ